MLDKEMLELQHKFRMEEIKYELDCRKEAEKFKHELDLETQRIRNADIKRSLMRKY